MPDFAGGTTHPAFDHLFAIGAARAQAPLKFAHRRGQDEDPDEVGAEGAAELLSPLPVDVEQDVVANLSASLIGSFGLP